MNIVIAGYGFVGHAVAAKFSKHMDVIVVDPKLGPETTADYADVEGVVVCVNTPSAADGSCDYSRVAHVLETVDRAIPVVIKSAVDVNGVFALKKQFPITRLHTVPNFYVRIQQIEISPHKIM